VSWQNLISKEEIHSNVHTTTIGHFQDPTLVLEPDRGKSREQEIGAKSRRRCRQTRQQEQHLWIQSITRHTQQNLLTEHTLLCQVKQTPLKFKKTPLKSEKWNLLDNNFHTTSSILLTFDDISKKITTQRYQDRQILFFSLHV
jgi:hypothetical protein